MKSTFKEAENTFTPKILTIVIETEEELKAVVDLFFHDRSVPASIYRGSPDKREVEVLSQMMSSIYCSISKE